MGGEQSLVVLYNCAIRHILNWIVYNNIESIPNTKLVVLASSEICIPVLSMHIFINWTTYLQNFKSNPQILSQSQGALNCSSGAQGRGHSICSFLAPSQLHLISSRPYGLRTLLNWTEPNCAELPGNWVNCTPFHRSVAIPASLAKPANLATLSRCANFSLTCCSTRFTAPHRADLRSYIIKYLL